MPFFITDPAALQQILDAAKSQEWSTAYHYSLEAMSDPAHPGRPADGVDPGVYLWVGGAEKINANEGSFSYYTREFNRIQYELQKGAPAPDWEQRIQAASDSIAENFVKTLLGVDLANHPDAPLPDNPPAEAAVPDIHTVGLIDAGAAASKIFTDSSSTGRSDYAPWVGTTLFTKLNDPSFFKDWVLTQGTSKYKQEPGTYELIATAQAVLEMKNLGYVLDVVLNNELGTYFDTVQLGTAPSASNSRATQTFFETTYGTDVGHKIHIGTTIFNDVVGVVENNGYRVGSTHDDSGAHALVLASSHDRVVNTGVGNDEIIADRGWAAIGATVQPIIDGGDGNDTLNYSHLQSPVSLHFDGTGAFGWRVLAHKGLDLPDGPRDAVYNIEHFILTDGNDQIERDDNLSTPDLVIDLGSGSNTLHLRHAKPSAAGPAAGTTHYRFSTHRADGQSVAALQVQEIHLAANVDHAVLKQGAILSVNDLQLAGGSSSAKNGDIIGGSGETYALESAGGIQSLTIAWPQRLGQAPYLIHIDDWQQGDFGIRLL
ncbi:hemolysin-type calcium-binding region [Lasius niger]|uniref:Hemolysin-type calcium-binding region n=1 Tax=Lasius niger TaxID=67767 RepID=A0A0J7N5T0_LASNI|nr:hemolysin-type calcium-binding region [Lasius niger]